MLDHCPTFLQQSSKPTFLHHSLSVTYLKSLSAVCSPPPLLKEILPLPLKLFTLFTCHHITHLYLGFELVRTIHCNHVFFTLPLTSVFYNQYTPSSWKADIYSTTVCSISIDHSRIIKSRKLLFLQTPFISNVFYVFCMPMILFTAEGI